MSNLDNERDMWTAINRSERTIASVHPSRMGQAVPVNIGGRVVTRKLASDKQRAFLGKLLAEREHDGFTLPTDRPLTSGEASKMIDILLDAPRKQTTRPLATPGYYLHGEDVYQVVLTKDKSRTYAKRMVIDGNKGRWEYAPGVGALLADMVPLTAEAAGALGQVTGVCMICGAELTNPESIERGIGPICASRL